MYVATLAASDVFDFEDVRTNNRTMAAAFTCEIEVTYSCHYNDKSFSLFFSRVKELHELVETTEKAAQVKYIII